MHFKIDRAPLKLAGGALLAIRDGQGQALRVLEGRVWLTQEGSLDDVFLDAGTSYRLEGPGRAVVTAEGTSDAVTTVLFDGPLEVHGGAASGRRWFGFLGALAPA